MARKVNPNNSMVSADMNSVKLKRQLEAYAYNKGYTLTDFIRTTFYKLLEDAPAHMKVKRKFDDED